MTNRRPDINRISLSAEGWFRKHVVAQVLVRRESGVPLADAVHEVAALRHLRLDGTTDTVSERSVYRWVADFESGGTAALETAGRPVMPVRALSPEFVDYAIDEKENDPEASIPEIIKRAREAEVLEEDEHVDRTTVYRALRRLGVSTRRRRTPADRDSRRYAYPHRMQCVLCDGKHFRAGATRLRRVALNFLDDATRMGMHVVVGTSESSELFLIGLYGVLSRYGYMDTIYLDQGPGFIAQDTIDVLDNLDILLIHGEAGYPQGHGKIEKYNQTQKAGVLRGLAREDVDPECSALDLRLRHYLRALYNQEPHAALKGQTPHERFHRDSRPLRLPENDGEIREKFVVYLERTVTGDHTVSVDSVDYEVPRGHAEMKVRLIRPILDGGIWFEHEDELIELQPVDLEFNARSRRGKSRPAEESASPPRKSAAGMAFERAYSPVVDENGGFRTQETDEQEETL